MRLAHENGDPTMIHRARASALVAALSLAGCGGDAPAPSAPPAPPAARGAAATPPAGSYGAVVAEFEKRQRDEEKRLKRDRCDAVSKYVASHRDAPDAEKALRECVALGKALEDWEAVVDDADAYVAAFPTSKAKPSILVDRAEALVELGRDAEAKPAFEGLTKTLDLDGDGLPYVWSAWSGLADLLANAGDAAGARSAYASLRERFPAAKEKPATTQLHALAERASAALDAVGKPPLAWPATAKDMDGKPVSLADYAGKVLLIDFWATWCGPCRAEIPGLVAAYGRWHPKGFEVLGVTLDGKDKADDVRDFLLANEMPWRQFYDGGHWRNEIAVLYGVRSIPHTVLVGKDGNVARVGLRGRALDRAIAKLLAPAPSASTPTK